MTGREHMVHIDYQINSFRRFIHKGWSHISFKTSGLEHAFR
jgi:hypothetical protein